MKTIIDDKIPYIRGEIEALISDCVYLPGSQIGYDDVKDADILIIRTRTRCDRHLLQGSKVRLIVTATIGYDHIDTQWCEANGIEWHNCPGCNANSVATYIKNVLTLLTPQLSVANRRLSIGIIGHGHVGSIVAANCRKSGYNVLVHDPFLGMNHWEQICHKTDIITFHVPLTHDGQHPTFHMADTRFFDSLKNRPVIINSSRGGVVDEQALLTALAANQIRGAVIDTWENEPNINHQLLSKAIISTPHIAGYSANGKLNATRMTLQTVAHWLKVRLDKQPSFDRNIDERLSPSTLLSDSTLLKAAPQNFEYFRSNYPQRVE